MAVASYENWNENNYVHSGGAGPGQVDGRFVNAEHMGLFMGPPRLANIGGNLALGAALTTPGAANQLVYPLGLTQQFNVGQNKNWSRVFEIGSKRSYFISGRDMGQLSFGTILHHGPSLLRTMYAYYQDVVPDVTVSPVFPNIGASNMSNPHDVKIPPGYENFFINLASDLFTQPVGMMMILKDNNRDTYGATYFECCVLPNHNFGTDASGVIVQEQVSVQFERIVPIATRALSLVA